jgi:hypothetical protein
MKRPPLSSSVEVELAEPTASSSSTEEDSGGRDEKDSKPFLVTSGARIGSRSDQEVVQEQATILGEVPYGWTRVKLEPGC